MLRVYLERGVTQEDGPRAGPDASRREIFAWLFDL